MSNYTTIIIFVLVFGGFFVFMAILQRNSLDGIKARPAGNGQHGAARWAFKRELYKTYKFLPYTVSKWRKGILRPTDTQGTILGYRKSLKKVTALIDEGDNHTLMIAAAGAGKTACFLYPNIEYACASGMSFLVTDTKGDIFRLMGTIAKKYYDYRVSVIDLRNPTKSDGFNMLKLVNEYTDRHKKSKSLTDKAKAEKYAKIIAKTIIHTNSNTDYGQNSFFYEAAEGLLTAAILIVAEFSKPEKRHIVSVYKIIQDLLAPSPIKDKSYFQLMMLRLPQDHKARWFAGAALNTSEEAMRSVMSTALSRLNGFLDSELEQILCFESCIDAEKFCNEKSALFLVLPEEDQTKHFLISLIVQQLYREILSVADELGGTLKNRVMFYLDEIGTIPKIESAEMMFSASRSRKVSIVAIIQSLAQLQKNYGKEGAEIIVDNTQNTIFGGFAPNSTTADTLSKALGEQTVLSGSVSKGKQNDSQSLQMIGRPLMTADELKALPKFKFIVMKTGSYPMKTDMKLFFEWGITFEEPYQVEEKSERKVEYADRLEIEKNIAVKFSPKEKVQHENRATEEPQAAENHEPEELTEQSAEFIEKQELQTETTENRKAEWLRKSRELNKKNE